VSSALYVLFISADHSFRSTNSAIEKEKLREEMLGDRSLIEEGPAYKDKHGNWKGGIHFERHHHPKAVGGRRTYSLFTSHQYMRQLTGPTVNAKNPEHEGREGIFGTIYRAAKVRYSYKLFVATTYMLLGYRQGNIRSSLNSHA
jgi:hypothetical protein